MMDPESEDTDVMPVRRSRRGNLGGWVGWSVFVIVLGVVFLYPALMLAFGALNDGLPEAGKTWSFDKLVAAWTSPDTYQTLFNSVVIAVVATVIAVALGTLFAWISTSTNVPGRKLLTPIMVLALLLPPLFYGFGWIMLANKQNGLLNYAVQQWFGVSGAPFDIESWGGLFFVSGLGFSPFAYLLLIGAFRNRDQAIDEASRIFGANVPSTLFRVTLPSIAPALTGVIALVVVLNLQSFDVPQLIGRPARIFVFSTEIYRHIYDFSPSDYGSAYSLSLMILLIVVVLFIAQRLVLGGRSYTTVSGKGFRNDPTELGGFRWVLSALIAVYAILNLVLPAGAVLLGSLEPVFGVHTRLTLDNYVQVFSSPPLLAALRLTAMLAVVGGLLSMIIALITSYVVLRRRGFLRNYTSLAVWMPWAMPGIVLALAYLWIVLSTPGLKYLYGTSWLMLIVLVIATIPLVSRIAEGALAQISPELEEAARVSGARPGRVLVGIVFRLVIGSFIAGWFLSGLFIAGNLSVPVMLSSPVTKPVATAAYELFASGQTATAAALFLIILAAALVVLALVGCWMYVLGKRQVRRMGQPPVTGPPPVTTRAMLAQSVPTDEFEEGPMTRA